MLQSFSKISHINFIKLLLLIVLIVCGNKAAIDHKKTQQHNIKTSQLSSSTNITPTTTQKDQTLVAYCGNTSKMVDDCFKDLPPHLMEFLQNTKIAINEEEVISKCKVFNRGMQCFDDYNSRCLTNETLTIFNNNIEGARRFFRKFCTDREFQRDYLRHKDCFSHIQEDWLSCTTLFQDILTEELHNKQKNITNKFFEFCCARHAYETCIYKSARYKCYKNSAKFAHETAKTLSEEKHFTNCRQYETTLCHSPATTQHITRDAILLLGLILLPIHYLILMRNN